MFREVGLSYKQDDVGGAADLALKLGFLGH